MIVMSGDMERGLLEAFARQFLNLTDAARYVGASRQTLLNRAAAGQLHRAGKSGWFLRPELDALKKERKQRAAKRAANQAVAPTTYIERTDVRDGSWLKKGRKGEG